MSKITSSSGEILNLDAPSGISNIEEAQAILDSIYEETSMMYSGTSGRWLKDDEEEMYRFVPDKIIRTPEDIPTTEEAETKKEEVGKKSTESWIPKAKGDVAATLASNSQKLRRNLTKLIPFVEFDPKPTYLEQLLLINNGAKSARIGKIDDDIYVGAKSKTIAGDITNIGSYIAAAAASTAALPLTPWLGALAGGEITAQALYADEGNIFNMVPKEWDNVIQDMANYIQAKDTDSELMKRIKLSVGEGVLLSGVVGFIGKAFKLANGKTISKDSDLKNLSWTETNEVIDKALTQARKKYLNSARGGARLKEQDSLRLSNAEIQKDSEQIYKQTGGKNNPLSYLMRLKQQIFTSRGYWTKQQYNAFNDAIWAQRATSTELNHIIRRIEKLTDYAVKNSFGSTKEIQNSFRNAMMDQSLFTVQPKSTRKFKDKRKKAVEVEEKAVLTEREQIEMVMDKYKLPEELAETVLEARGLIDNLSKKFADSSFPDQAFKDIVTANVGSYITRAYKLFEVDNFEPTKKIQNDAKKYLIKQGKTLQEAKDIVADILTTGRKGGPANVSNFYAVMQKISKYDLAKRQDIPAPIRRLMGEITEPDQSLMVSVSKLSRMVTSTKFYNEFKRLGEAGGYVGKEGGVRTVEIDNIHPSIDGLFTTPEMLKAIKGQESYIENVFSDNFTKILRPFTALKTHTQKMMTVWNHTTQFRNFYGGTQMSVTNGINPFNEGLTTAKLLFKTLGSLDDKQLRETYKEYQRLGIINTNVRLGEIRQHLRNYNDALDIEDYGILSRGKDNWLDKASKVPDAVGLTKVDQGLQKIYQGVDDFFKINAYHYELDTLRKALPNASEDVLKEQAAAIIRNTFPNYDRVPKAVRSYSRVAGNFVSFTAEILRTRAHVLRQAFKELNSGVPELKVRGVRRLAGFNIGLGMYAGLGIGSAHLAGLDEDDKKDWDTLTETDWDKDSHKIYKVDKDNPDKIYIFATQHVDSELSIKAPFMALIRRFHEGKLTEENTDRAILGTVDTVVRKILEPFLNVENKMIYPDWPVFAQQIMSASEIARSPEGVDAKGRPLPDNALFDNTLAYALQPLLPGEVSSALKLYERVTDNPVDKYTGQPKSIYNEYLGSILGVRFKEHNKDSSLTAAYNRYLGKTGTMERANKIDTNYGKMTAQEAAETYIKREELRYDLQREFFKKYLAHINLSDGKDTITHRVLDDRGAPDQFILALAANRFSYKDFPNASGERQNRGRNTFFEKTKGTEYEKEKAWSMIERFYRQARNTTLFSPDPETYEDTRFEKLNVGSKRFKEQKKSVLEKKDYDKIEKAKGGRLTARGRYQKGTIVTPDDTVEEELQRRLDDPTDYYSQIYPEETSRIEAPRYPTAANIGEKLQSFSRYLELEQPLLSIIDPVAGVGPYLTNIGYGKKSTPLEVGVAALDIVGGVGDVAGVGADVVTPFLGIMASAKAKSGVKKVKELQAKEAEGLNPEEIWEAQKDEKFKAYRSPVDGRPRFEIRADEAKLIKGTSFDVPIAGSFGESKKTVHERMIKDRNFSDTRDKDWSRFRKRFEEAYGRPPKVGDTYYDHEVYNYINQTIPIGKLELGDILDFQDLFDEYPQLRGMNIERVPSTIDMIGVKGMYSPTTKTIYLNRKGIDEDQLSTILHEVQHAVQDIEGLPFGDSVKLPENFKNYKKIVKKELQDAKDNLNKNVEPYLDSLIKTYGDDIPNRSASLTNDLFDAYKTYKSVPASKEMSFSDYIKSTKDNDLVISNEDTRELLDKMIGLSDEEIKILASRSSDPASLAESAKKISPQRQAKDEFLSYIEGFLQKLDTATEKAFELDYYTRLEVEKATKKYTSTAGEVEARNVQIRPGDPRYPYTRPSQYDKPPWETMDTPVEDIRFAEQLPPTSEVIDDFGRYKADMENRQTVKLPKRKGGRLTARGMKHCA